MLENVNTKILHIPMDKYSWKIFVQGVNVTIPLSLVSLKHVLTVNKGRLLSMHPMSVVPCVFQVRLDHMMPLINYDIIGCELMEMEPETLPLFDGFCQSIIPIAKSECPTRCYEDDTIKCCITSFVTKADKFECEDNPGVAEDLKYQDGDDCICEPCG